MRSGAAHKRNDGISPTPLLGQPLIRAAGRLCAAIGMTSSSQRRDRYSGLAIEAHAIIYNLRPHSIQAQLMTHSSTFMMLSALIIVPSSPIGPAAMSTGPRGSVTPLASALERPWCYRLTLAHTVVLIPEVDDAILKMSATKYWPLL